MGADRRIPADFNSDFTEMFTLTIARYVAIKERFEVERFPLRVSDFFRHSSFWFRAFFSPQFFVTVSSMFSITLATNV